VNEATTTTIETGVLVRNGHGMYGLVQATKGEFTEVFWGNGLREDMRTAELRVERIPGSEAPVRFNEIMGTPRIGPTGEFPHGAISEEDRGELAVMVYSKGGRIITDFGTTLSFLAMRPIEAIGYARVLMQKARDAGALT